MADASTGGGPGEEERQRVSGYLLSQGEKYGWLELWPRVVQGRLEFLEAIRDVNEKQGEFRPGEGDWTIREVAHHVLAGSHSHLLKLPYPLLHVSDSPPTKRRSSHAPSPEHVTV